ncbi:choice-of-anchor P family protein [Kribbella deserti]|uniref:Choice-of-anchor P family protein n=1 Tax=Kribbella deserti TaxID=1926257 RepID=A0ABV6QHI6_9ACTN
MRPRIGYKKLVAAGAVAVVGVASTIALTSGSATAAQTFGYAGFAHGTYIYTGLANSGPQVSSQLACTSKVGLRSTNDLATANVNRQAIARTVKTETITVNDKRGNGNLSKATAVDVKLGNLLTLKGVENWSTAVNKNGKFEATAGTKIVSIKIGNLVVPKLIDASPNTKVAVPGLGFIVLNYQKLSTTSTSAVANSAAVLIHSTIKNNFIPKGATVAVLLTKAEVGGPVSGVLRAKGFGTEVRVGDLVKSSPTSLQTMCINTGGKAVTQGVAEVHIPNLIYVGAVTTTKRGTTTADSAVAEMSAKTGRVTIGSGKNKIVVEAVTSWAKASKTVGTNTQLSGGSKVLSIRVGDKVIPVPQGVNKTVNVLDIASLTFNKVEKRGSVIAVTALEVRVKALNTVVKIAYSEAGVIG